MKLLALIPLFVLAATAVTAQAQSSIWRCGNSYTNNAVEAKANGCKLVEGGNVTVVEGTRVSTAPARAPASGSNASAGGGSPAQRVDSNEQRARDADARAILESELKKAEARQAELQKEYNNGEPDKLGPETKNHQKYLDRVADLKASIARNENDIAGLKRELNRLGGPSSAVR